jgi:hypothetical protein
VSETKQIADLESQAHATPWAFFFLREAYVTPRSRLGRTLTGHTWQFDKPEGIDYTNYV